MPIGFVVTPTGENSFDVTTNLNGIIRGNGSNSFLTTLIDSADIVTAAIKQIHLSQMGATTGQVLKWNGTTWAPGTDLTGSGAGEATVRSVNVSGGLTGLTFTGGPITDSGVINMGGVLNVSSGGTGVGSLAGILVGNGTSAFSAKTGTAGQLLRRNVGNTDYEFFG
jgi:hypothetical protein